MINEPLLELPKILKQFKIKPTDNLMRKFADLDISWITVICEFLNNAIAKAKDSDTDLKITLKFVFSDDKDQKLTNLHIMDKSGGIDLLKIEECLTPGVNRKQKITLNEHSMGLNLGIEYMTKNGGAYVLKSYTENEAFQINQALSFTNEINVQKIPNKDYSGLELSFYNINNGMSNLNYPASHMSPLWLQLWAHICAKYRFMHDIFTNSGKKFEINIEAYCGDRKTSRSYIPVRPTLFNTVNGQDEWLTSFTLKSENYEVLFNIGRASETGKSYSFTNGDNIINNQNSPYRNSSSNTGFDLIYKDVIIKSMDPSLLRKLTESNSVITSHWYLFRGEIIIKRGGKSTITKDALQEDSELEQIYDEALSIITGKTINPTTDEKLDYLNKFISVVGRSGSQLPSEKVMKYRYRQYHESQNKVISQEQNTLVGRMDYVLDNKQIYEFKIKKTKIADVNQLFSYMVSNPKMSVGVLISTEHADNVTEYVNLLNENFLKDKNQKIVLEKYLRFLSNSNLTEEEKEL